MSKKFNGHRCERRNLTDLVLGTGPSGDKRPAPKAKKRSKNFTTEPAVNKMNPGGPTMTPGQFPDFMRQYLEGQGNMSLASSGGQAAGQFITGMSDTANDPTAKYGVGEGLGAAVSGAFNPLAMSLGPLGMLAGAGIGLAKSHFSHTREKNEFLEEQERLKDERIISNEANANDMSRQVLSIYNQQGVGGGYYARHGGPVDKFYTGGPTEPPAVMPGMEQYAQYSNLNPELAAAVGNMPERNDRLTSFTDAEMIRNKNLQNARVDAASLATAKDVAGNVVQYHMDKPLDALGMDLAMLGQLPIVGEPADLLNAGISGTRAAYNTAIGDTAKAQEQALFASLSAASAIPFIGNATGLARVAKGVDTVATGVNLGKAVGHVAHGAHDLERAVIAGKGMKAATYQGYEMGGPVDYETEKREVILASPNDPPIAVGQGKYNRISGNLYKGNGPSHEQGGIPTRGATEPFIDNAGQPMDSPYVFSDSKDMRFNADEILSMIR